MEEFDLTTVAGCDKVARFLAKDNIARGMRILFPFPYLAFKLGKALMDKIFADPKEQGRVVEDILKAGKERGIREMEIIMEDKGGIGGMGKLADYLDATISVHIGKNQKIIIRAKYF